MAIDDKPLTQLKEADLLALVGAEPERKTLEYKRDLPGNSEKDRKEFLYDATSFANTRGGYLIFGMEETDGLPTNLVGVPGQDAEAAILRMEQMLRSGVRPSVVVDTTAVPLANGASAIVMHIPKSWQQPHQVTFQNSFRFYARDSKGKYNLDVDDLRTVFAASASTADRLRDFRAERVAKIAASDGPVSLLDGAVIVIHVVPFSAFSVGNGFPIQDARPEQFAPFGKQRSVQRGQMTFDGLLVTSNSNPPPEPQRAYVQVLRTGAIEAVASHIEGSQRHIFQPEIEARIVRYVTEYMAGLRALSVEPPIAVMVSLLRVHGVPLASMRLSPGSLAVDLPSQALARDQLHFVESVFSAMPGNQDQVGEGMRATLDHLANAAGLPASNGFDSFGAYVNRDH